MPSAMVSIVPVRAALEGASLCGLRPEEVLALAKIDPTRLDDPNARLSELAEQRIWRAMLTAADASIGAQAASALPRGALGTVEYAMRTAGSLGEALEVLVEHSRSWYAAELFRLTPSADGIHLGYRSPHPVDRPMYALASEFLLTAIARVLADASGVPHILRRASVRHGTSASAPRLATALGVPVAVRASRDQLVFPVEVLGRVPREVDPRLNQILRMHLEGVAKELPRATDLVRVTQQCIEERLGEGGASIEQVSRSLGLGPRALQARLRRRGVTYRQLVDRARVTLAKSYLRRTEEALAQIAENLGYSDASSFHRGFKRITGLTPAAYREASDTPPPSSDRESPPPTRQSVAS